MVKPERETQRRDDAVSQGLARRLGPFDATMIVMGGIVGSGIFINPSVVARQVHTPALILGAWLAGGLVALLGALVYAELAARRPEVGGQYAYLRDAYHPSVAFLYGWALLLVIQTGGMAAVAVTFSRYFVEVTRAPLSDSAVAVSTLALLTVVNCLGVRAGSNVQSLLMVLKILAVAALVACGLFLTGGEGRVYEGPLLDRPASPGLLADFGAAMTPVMFAYGGWQTASFISGELRDPRRDLARGLRIVVVACLLTRSMVPLRAGGRRARGDEDARLGVDAARARREGRAAHRGRHHHLDSGLPQSGDAHRAARLLRDGRGRTLLQGRRAAHARHARPRRRDCVAGRARRRHRALGQLRADTQHVVSGNYWWADARLILCSASRGSESRAGAR